MKKLIILLLFLFIPAICFASGMTTTSNRIEDSISMNQWAHFGIGYIINDQLKKDTHLTFWEREGVSIFLAYAKQQWISKPSGSGFKYSSMNAQIIGANLVEIRF